MRMQCIAALPDCGPLNELYSPKISAHRRATAAASDDVVRAVLNGDVRSYSLTKGTTGLRRPNLKMKAASMNVSDAIRTKRVIRKFRAEPIADAEIRLILHAGRRAPSSKNEQSWHFIAVRDKTVLQALSECGTWAGHLAGAALGVAILTPDPLAKFQTMFDAGQAAAYMQLAAWDLGIGSCPASIYEADAARVILGFPPDLFLRIALSFGYPDDEANLSAPPRQGGRHRLEDLAHYDKW
jgi:nitroreductase